MSLKIANPKYYLTQENLLNLSDHKYSCSGRSFIEPLFQIFWNWVIKYVPISIAPNTLTFIGLIVNIISAITVIYWSPDGKSSIPPWCLIVCALGLFFYQTLDAIDGKQARRTNTSSQLGELFDHGCDALSSNFVVLASIVSVKMGTYPWLMFMQFFITSSLFYMAHWQVYVTGNLQFGSFDVTESQTTVIGVYLISAILGVEFWDGYIPIINMQGQIFYFSVMLICGIYMGIRFLKMILRGGVGRHGATIANTSILFLFCPIAFVIIMATIIAIKSPNQVYESNPCLFLLTFGMITCKVTQKLIVGHMTKKELVLFDTESICPILMILNQYLLNSYFNEWILLCICCSYSTFDMMWYDRKICLQIADYLNIYIFSVQKIARKSSSSDLSNFHNEFDKNDKLKNTLSEIDKKSS